MNSDGLVPQSSLLLEREEEQAVFAAAVREVTDGTGQAVVVAGPLGIGKSRLIRAARDAAMSHGFRVIAARGGPDERLSSWALVRQLLAPLLARCVAPTRHEPVSVHARDAARLLDPAALDVDSDSSVLPEVLYSLLREWATERPLAVVVDDCHWADSASLQFLVHLARRVDFLPVLLVVSVCEADGAGCVSGALAAAPPVEILHPRPFTLDATGWLLRERLGAVAPPLVAACQRVSGGNPWLVHELAEALRRDGIEPTASHAPLALATGASAIGSSLAFRIAEHGRDPTRLAEAAAVMGDGESTARVADLAGLSPAATDAAMRRLQSIGVLAPGDSVRIPHPLIAAALYQQLSPRERAERHARAATVLAGSGASVETVAAHLAHTVPSASRQVVTTLQKAARAARRRGRADLAARYLERALAEPPDLTARAEVLHELGSSELASGRGRPLDHLLEAVEATADRRRAAEAGELAAVAALVSGQPSLALALARRCREVALADNDLRHRLEAVELAALLVQPATEALEERVCRLRTLGDGGLGARAVQALLSYRDARRGDAAPNVVRRAEAAVSGAELMRSDAGGPAFVLAGSVLAYADTGEAVATMAQGVAVARGAGAGLAVLVGTIGLGQAHRLTGDLRTAVTSGQEAVRLARLHGSPGLSAWAASSLGEALVDVGDAEAASGVLRATPRHSPDGVTALAFSRLLALEGDLEGSLREALSCGRRFSAVGGANPALCPWRSVVVRCLTRLGRDMGWARDLAEEELAEARAFGAPRAIGVALTTLGNLVGGQVGIELLVEATEVLDRSPAHLEAARSQVAAGQALARACRFTAARRYLSSGLDRATACGAAGLVVRARSELRAAGARPRRPASGPSSLTPAERRVAELVVGGDTNAVISRKLVVSSKTVEFHLANVYRKLGVRTRVQLTRVFDAEEDGHLGSKAGVAG